MAYRKTRTARRSRTTKRSSGYARRTPRRTTRGRRRTGASSARTVRIVVEQHVPQQNAVLTNAGFVVAGGEGKQVRLRPNPKF